MWLALQIQLSLRSLPGLTLIKLRFKLTVAQWLLLHLEALGLLLLKVQPLVRLLDLIVVELLRHSILEALGIKLLALWRR